MTEAAPSKTIRILLVDDHYVIRMGLAAILGLEPDLRVVAEAEDAAGAVSAFREHRPDVTLMDLRMPGGSGVEATEAIRREFPEARIIVLTTYDMQEDIHRALQAGARGYVLKKASREELVAAIRHVHAGDRYIPPEVAGRLVERAGAEELSAREVEVLRLAARGLSNKGIAEALEFTEHTAKAHMKRILAKLGAADRTEAVTIALRRGIVSLD